MHTGFKGTYDALLRLEKAIEGLTIQDGLMTNTLGVEVPAITSDDLIDQIICIINKLKAYGDIELTEKEIAAYSSLPEKIDTLIRVHVPEFSGVNSARAISSYMLTLAYVDHFLDESFTWKRLDNANLLPRNLSRKIKSMEARINKIDPEMDALESKVKTINDAHVAAENIPIDLNELKEYNKEASDLKEKISKTHFSLESQEEAAKKIIDELQEKNIEAARYLALCEEAIRASTSRGLAGAFEIKADKLNRSIQLWVAGLAVALGLGGLVGYERLKVLSGVLNNPNPSAVVILTQLLLSVFSIGAPLWFAWMSTKQINQRFKLAEDYAYKASVAKAYEGYKNEACKVSDGEFEKRLFDSALSRLEEAPLRFVKDEDHTTPWTEMLNSKSFQKFLDASIDNVNYVKGIISKKGQSAAKASNDEVNHIEKLKNEA
ncbi:hypothetical protein LUL72_002054 [Escherichia coli]|uniref:hypothetical protein n=1 Tax=Escherichia coli TaxID=562 RepID=UPI00069CA1B1|nr:hypothetical protein [Escherichia coli]EEY1408784.1 hypothetical protein [Escherichia coli]EEZ2099899.1 hypothetical protein [Escherichia coli]EFC5409281.1 hypothetical protein [Escherichia coli]EHM2839306.1 hypothetical protein [Escherichia coli]EHM2883481.1 hypothetical protein [Escherichia coli]